MGRPTNQTTRRPRPHACRQTQVVASLLPAASGLGLTAGAKGCPHQTTATNISRRLDRNIQALLRRREEEARRFPLEDRIAERITRFAGSFVFVYFHAVVFSLWILVNVGLLPGLQSSIPLW